MLASQLVSRRGRALKLSGRLGAAQTVRWKGGHRGHTQFGSTRLLPGHIHMSALVSLPCPEAVWHGRGRTTHPRGGRPMGRSQTAPGLSIDRGRSLRLGIHFTARADLVGVEDSSTSRWKERATKLIATIREVIVITSIERKRRATHAVAPSWPTSKPSARASGRPHALSFRLLPAA